MSRVDIISLGGLGSPQTLALNDVLRAIPGTYLFAPHEHGDPLNEYQMDIIAGVEILAPTSLVLIGHSLACDTVINAADALAAKGIIVDLVVVIAPVWANKKKPTCRQIMVFKPQTSIFPQADVEGVIAIDVPNTGHNTICQSPTVIQAIAAQVSNLSSIAPAPSLTASVPAAQDGGE